MDRRVQETQKKMVGALRVLMQRYPWDAITVATICQESSIARSTFYSHFDTKDDLMQLSLEYLATELAPVDTRRGLDSARSLKFLPALLDHIKDHRLIVVKNVDTAAASMIQKNIAKTIEGLVYNEVQASRYADSVHHSDLLFMCGGLGAIAEKWIGDECRESVASVVATIDDLIERAMPRE